MRVNEDQSYKNFEKVNFVPQILIACLGNILRQDDGFGVEVAKRFLNNETLPKGVKVVELGIAGVTLVQELLGCRYDALIIVDIVHRNGKPGTVYKLEVNLPEMSSFSQEQLREMLTDMHTTEPSKALILARALNVLPVKVFVIGCEPETCDELTTELSEPVEQAVDKAIEEVGNLCKIFFP